ncbi:carbohydrate kinase FGGY [Petrotoga mobilis SJ95]|uniref:Carbohydrate kinase FGGY n=2 Tax=Petrotoga TaxID=28236 RepID=A9BGQ2_PETMO|nr:MULTISPECIES: sedoheptulokinase [Petrotoga]ABX32292.1 carbohydrate kinase FGGY [Petrotoga mobilis SJ95]MBL5981678.1 hypothetical protein [Petrotoga sp. 8T1HF07.NaAc.6.1]MDN5345947.1 hypothetical protein [Petrotoga sp.]POZ92026.1 hypothetical protein AA81_09625 [Petrotoga halophila DSM 16923]
MKVLGIDFGTTSYSACLYDSKSKEIAFANKQNTSLIFDGLKSEFDIKKLESDFDSFIKYLTKVFDLKGTKAISVTGNMHSFFLVKDNTPITNIITWQDQRALEKNENGITYVDYINKNYKSLFSKFQYFLSPGYAVTTLLPLQKFLRTSGFSLHFAPDFIVKKLTGDTTYDSIPIDPTIAHSSGFYALENKDWNWKLINALGYSEIHLPKIAEPGTFVGNVGKYIPQLTGTPIFLGMGDNQASVLGAIFEKKLETSYNKINSMVISIGTSGQISAVVKEIKRISKYIDYRPFLNNYYLLVGASLSAGKTIDTIKDFIKSFISLACKKNVEDDYVYEFIKNSMLPVSPLKFRTTLNGTRYNPQLRGAIDNISLNNFTIQNLVTAAAYGIVEELYKYYREMNIDYEDILGVGNGLQKNKYFISIIKKVFNKNFYLSKLEETTSFGAAVCAMEGKTKGEVDIQG